MIENYARLVRPDYVLPVFKSLMLMGQTPFHIELSSLLGSGRGFSSRFNVVETVLVKKFDELSCS
jgi:hypothetical protein